LAKWFKKGIYLLTWFVHRSDVKLVKALTVLSTTHQLFKLIVKLFIFGQHTCRHCEGYSYIYAHINLFRVYTCHMECSCSRSHPLTCPQSLSTKAVVKVFVCHDNIYMQH